jgi:branched-subunit amino acid aminotransferase/4-amino-4-deoxychorismate lyase
MNPRANGYNYGVGWGSTAKPPIYAEAQALALHLNRLANEATRLAWALEMAIRDVRLAETDTEKKQSVTNLAIELAKHRSRQTQAA